VTGSRVVEQLGVVDVGDLFVVLSARGLLGTVLNRLGLGVRVISPHRARLGLGVGGGRVTVGGGRRLRISGVLLVALLGIARMLLVALLGIRLLGIACWA